MTQISTLGEFGLIRHLTNDITPKQPTTLRGIGDDCAVLKGTDRRVSLLTTDMLMEGIHFDLQ